MKTKWLVSIVSFALLLAARLSATSAQEPPTSSSSAASAAVQSAAPEHRTSASTPKPVPAGRREMLLALDALKHRQARLPLPEPTAEELQQASAAVSNAAGPPRLSGIVNNGRMRALYLPPALQSGRGRTPTSDQGFDYAFATELFWIVSRVNNCHYCLGHQEHKLEAAGVDESMRLALDTDWKAFEEPQQAAFRFTRQLTMAPHEVTDADLAALRKHFSDDQILELTFLVGRYNATNRWTDSLGIPQEAHRTFHSTQDVAATETPLGETSSVDKPSIVATMGFAPRSWLADPSQWTTELTTNAKRQPRLQLAISKWDGWNSHLQLLERVDAAGPEWVRQVQAALTEGELPIALRPQIGFVAAAADRAWYMQAYHRRALREQGLDDPAIFALADGRKRLENDAPESLALAFAHKLTVDPQSITDAEIERLLTKFTAQQVAEIVYHTGLAAMLNRLTEVAGLGYPPLSD